MTQSYEKILSGIESVTEERIENAVQCELMTKAQHLFHLPVESDDRHRLPDMVDDLELVVERTSCLIDKNDPNRPQLTYRRLYIKRDGEEQLDLNSQMIEYTEWSDAVPIEIVIPNRYPEAEVDPQIMTEKIGGLLDRHLARLANS